MQTVVLDHTSTRLVLPHSQLSALQPGCAVRTDLVYCIELVLSSLLMEETEVDAIP